MKIRIIAALIALMAVSASAAPEELHHYGFILSCGETRYRSFDHELSITEVLKWTDYFEDTVCHGLTPSESGIQ